MLTRLTDRDERALLAAAENRITEPLRLGAALAAVGRLLRRERESVTCHPAAAHQTSTGTSSSTGSPRRQPTAPLPR
ncbi:hypothetical protein [Streptomyces sp. NBC_01244]|uniref:hypothetical protein n=1 Tax=Streptomyces sp. NBC_01244 TaxID=2903797 RepID=UPI002E0F589A|nr:hypothetical protein OG247_34715 [Streptomyces sp. NBC_01244]